MVWGEKMARERKFSMEELYQLTKENLLQHGYDGFTFSHLADQLEVSRGTIYKYYQNKDELIMDYMIYDMNLFLIELKEIEKHTSFEGQLEFLLDLIFSHSKIYHIIEIGMRMPTNTKKLRESKAKLDKLHLAMYENLLDFIKLGKAEKKVHSHLPDTLILGYIFQSIAIPNHFGIPHDEWVKSLKDIIRHGMLTVRN
jgi:TetR/AcrR family transcriptional regulator, repressor of fatR-cypB operon